MDKTRVNEFGFAGDDAAAAVEGEWGIMLMEVYPADGALPGLILPCGYPPPGADSGADQAALEDKKEDEVRAIEPAADEAVVGPSTRQRKGGKKDKVMEAAATVEDKATEAAAAVEDKAGGKKGK